MSKKQLNYVIKKIENIIFKNKKFPKNKLYANNVQNLNVR